MKSIICKYFFIIVLGVIITVGCSKSDDQRKFENQALSSQPSGITYVNANGEIDETNTDPDDWRISPTYAGLIRVETPIYPNPAAYNANNLQIEIYLRVDVQKTNGIEVWAFKNPGISNLYGPLDVVDFSNSSSFISITLSGELIAGSQGGAEASDTYRVLVYDEERRNLITYGDVQIGSQ